MRLASLAVPLTALALLSGCKLGEVRDAGPVTTKTYPAGNFTQLAVAGDYDVTVSTGSQPGVQATGGQARLDDLVVEVSGDTLKIHSRQDGGSWKNDKGVKVSVTVPGLTGVQQAGSGNVTLNSAVGASFNAALAGSGDMTINDLRSQQFEARVAGSGNLKAKGAVSSAKVALAGSGDVEAPDLVTNTADISVLGSGNVKLQAKQSANISIAGSGDVTITGGGKCTTKSAGSGEARCS